MKLFAEKLRDAVILVAMEVYLEGLPTYAGGLGFLTGDILLSAADIGYPMVCVTLLHDRGYIQHEVKEGKVFDYDEPYDPLDHHEKLSLKLELNLRSGPIYLNVWRHWIKGLKSEVPVYMLDSNTPENSKNLREITSRVYIENRDEERLIKELILGLGALELVKKLGLSAKKFHLNESHAGFLALELLKKYKNLDEVRSKVVFTTHTPLPYGHEQFDYGLVEEYYEVPAEVKAVSPEALKMTRVLEFLSGYYNCVSYKFSKVHEILFPGSTPDYITNGVHHLRWVHDRVAKLYDKWLNGWRNDPSRLVYAASIPLKEVEEIKALCKVELVDYVNSRAHLNKVFDSSSFIASLRRRITGYKRVTLILRDQELLETLGKKYNLQLIFSGTVHPKDLGGREELRTILDAISTLVHVRIAFSGKRGAKLEKLLAAGSDLWLHTPRPPFEACGTSWMRAALNLTPTLASHDGGVLEGIADGQNGWLFGKDAMSPDEPFDERADLKDFYAKLRGILDLYSTNKSRYMLTSTYAAARIGSYFNTSRALSEYISRAYEP
ncbi:MAG: alpha-glucan family phosphorylase [Thermofilaceae archaeon]